MSVDPGLNFNLVFYISLFKSRFRIIFPILFFECSIIKLKTKRVKLNFLFKLSDLKTSFILTVGYLNPVLNNPALIMKELSMFFSGCGTEVVKKSWGRASLYRLPTDTLALAWGGWGVKSELGL